MNHRKIDKRLTKKGTWACNGPGLFASVMRQRRLALNLTMGKLARLMKTTKSYVSGVENGRINPFGHRKIPRVALALGVDVRAMQIMAWADKAHKSIRVETRTLARSWVRDNVGVGIV